MRVGGSTLSDDCPPLAELYLRYVELSVYSTLVFKDDLSAFGSSMAVCHCFIILVERIDTQAVTDVNTSLPYHKHI